MLGAELALGSKLRFAPEVAPIILAFTTEMEADRELLGASRATDVMNFWAGDHYRWVYKTVINDESTIRKVIEARHLNLK